MDLDLLAETLVNAIGVRIERALAPVVLRVQALEGRGVLTSEDVRALVDKAVGPSITAAVASINVPQDGADGKDADPLQTAAMIQSEVTRQVAAMPRPENGKDANPEVVRELVRKAVAELPAPKDGESVDVGTLMTQINAAAARAVEALPKPENGKSIDAADVAAMIGKEVERQIKTLPTPKDGASVTVEDVLPAITGAVNAAVERIPVPKDGTSVDPSEVQAMVTAAFAQIPVPQNGKSVEPAAVEAMVRAEVERAAVPDLVARAIAEIPKPKDGESVHPDTVRVMLGELVEAAVKSLPAPEPGDPGKDADPAEMARAVHEEVQRQFDAIRPLIKGEPGEAGAGLQDMSMEIKEDGRTLVFKFVGHGFEKNVEVVAPWQIYRGVWKAATYQLGDVVTYAGSSWTALKDTSDPPGKSEDWQLSVKRGKDA